MSGISSFLIDADYGRLAGIIFPNRPYEYMLAPLVKTPTPCVAMTRDKLTDISTVWVDYGGFFRQSYDYLFSNNCQRIAVLSEVQMPLDYITDLCAYAKQKDCPILSEFILGFRLEASALAWLDNLIALLFYHPPEQRPDGLIIANEYFRDNVLHVLQQKHIRPGKDVQIVQHVNFPASLTNPYPIERLGFDIVDIIATCINTIKKYRQDKIIAHDTLIPVRQD